MDSFVTVDGDAEGGWIVQVYDGKRHATYSPNAATADEAKQMALDAHAAAQPVANDLESRVAALEARMGKSRIEAFDMAKEHVSTLNDDAPHHDPAA